MNILTLISTTLVCRTRLFLCIDSQAQESCMRCSNQQRMPHPTRTDPPADVAP